jgi:hypothetical protein
MIPLRRQLIVQEHGNLPTPKAPPAPTCSSPAKKAARFASRVFLGLGLGGSTPSFQNENLFKAWPGTPEYQPDFGPQHVLKGASIKADATPEYLGVGYIIGPASPASSLPAASSPGSSHAAHLLLRQGTRPPHLSRHHPHRADGPQPALVHLHPPMGAGAVAAAGLITLIKTLPTIVSALTAGFKNMRPGAAAAGQTHPHRRRSLHARVSSARCSSSPACSSSSSSSPSPAPSSDGPPTSPPRCSSSSSDFSSSPSARASSASSAARPAPSPA